MTRSFVGLTILFFGFLSTTKINTVSFCWFYRTSSKLNKRPFFLSWCNSSTVNGIFEGIFKTFGEPQLLFLSGVFWVSFVLLMQSFFFFFFDWPPCYPFLSSVAPSRSSKQHPVSAQSWFKSFLAHQRWHVHVYESIRERRLCVCPCFSSSALVGLRDGRWVTIQLLFYRVLLPGFVLHVVFLCSSHLPFSPWVSLLFM